MSGSWAACYSCVMHAFRQRPLTWLFWIATFCLDMVALSTDNESHAANALALGQLFVASGWLVLGRSHRLVRAATFVIAIGLLTAPDYVIPRLGSRFHVDLVWPNVLGMLIVMGLATAVMTFLWLNLARLTSRGLKEFRLSHWQFPLAELFGWMIVVAVASAGLRLADFSTMDNLKDISLGMALTYLAGALMAFSLGDHNRGRRAHAPLLKIMVAGVILLMIWVLATSLPVDAQVVAVGALGYTACWVIAMRLDRQFSPRETVPAQAASPEA